MISIRFLSGLLLFAWFSVIPISAWASCGASSCPVEVAGWDERKAGSVTLGYQFEYSEQDQLRIGTRDAAFREIRGHHDEEFTVNRIHRFLASIGLSDRFSVDVGVPFVSRSHAHIHRHQGQDILEAWDLSGFGDLSVQGRFAFFKPSCPAYPTLSAIVGGEFPTGSHTERNDAGDVAEAGLQPGSNSTDLILGLSSLQKFSAPMFRGGYGTLPFFTSVLGQINGPGSDDYRLGDTLQVNMGTSYPLFKQVGLLAQLNFLLRDRDGKGRTGEEIQKTGGEILYFSPGLEFRPTEDWRFYALVQVPVYQRVNLIQTVSDYNVLFGMSYRFRGWGKR